MWLDVGPGAEPKSNIFIQDEKGGTNCLSMVLPAPVIHNETVFTKKNSRKRKHNNSLPNGFKRSSRGGT